MLPGYSTGRSSRARKGLIKELFTGLREELLRAEVAVSRHKEYDQQPVVPHCWSLHTSHNVEIF
jgi:hypothetical protein